MEDLFKVSGWLGGQRLTVESNKKGLEYFIRLTKSHFDMESAYTKDNEAVFTEDELTKLLT